MEDELFKEVQKQLKARQSEWREIADELAPDVSLSWIEKVGRGHYDSSPTYKRLQTVARYLREHPKAS